VYVANPGKPTLAPCVRDWRTARAFLLTAAVGAVVIVTWSRLAGFQSIPAMLLVYVVGFPGLFGLGWFALYRGLRMHYDKKLVNEYVDRAQRFLLQHAKVERFEHCDIDIVEGDAEALAIEGSTLHVLYAGRYQAIPLHSLLQWEVSGGGPAVLARAPNLSATLQQEAFRADERAARAKVEGVFLTTNDRSEPLVHIRLLEPEVRKRWAAVLTVASAS
jgi:hypothetical protein